MQAFFEGVVEQKCEGLMVKLLESGEGITGEDDEDDEGDGTDGKKRKGKDKGGKKKPLPATYEPDQRSQGWLKVKKGELSRVYRAEERLFGRSRGFAGSGPDRGLVGPGEEGGVVESDTISAA